MKNIIKILLVPALILSSCDRLLNEKSNSRLATPETLADNQALLDRDFNTRWVNIAGEISSTDVYVTDADYNRMRSDAEKRLYTWQPDRVSDTSNDWQLSYLRIYTYNLVLHNLKTYNIANSDNVKGQALLLRAAAYLDLAQSYCLAYDKNNADNQQGVPLRLDPDMNQKTVQSTLKETYKQVIDDLLMAETLLPKVQISTIRPSKASAFGYLSRAYLYMGDYPNALLYATKSLEINNVLLDYNALDSKIAYPIPALNEEIIAANSMASSVFLGRRQAKVNIELYNSYEENDLRKDLFFSTDAGGYILFRGNYSGTSIRCGALANDEIYLNIAESHAQMNNPTKAMEFLNELLRKRWKSGTFSPLVATNAESALEIIRIERRKELLLRGLRWSDIKRYNRDGANIQLTKIVDGETYVLPPNDLRYAVAIPEIVIEMTGIQQNKR
ncbi:RagB/SusD family nutrient uptake outer membrane protein [Chryseobacterium sp. A301]